MKSALLVASLSVGVYLWSYGCLNCSSNSGNSKAVVAPERDRSVDEGVDTFNFVLIATNDLHSAFLGSGPDHSFTASHSDGDPVTGHYARLCHLIQEKRAAAAARGESALVVDAGDFFAGSAGHIVGPSKLSKRAPELEFFKVCGYDAGTLGNHDFEPGVEGMIHMLSKHTSLNLVTPLVVSNVDFNNSNYATASLQSLGLNSDDFEFQRPEEGPLRRLLVRTLTFQSPSSDSNNNGNNDNKNNNKKTSSLRVGLIGLHGPDASLCNTGARAPISFVGFNDTTSDAHFDDMVTVAASAVEELRTKHRADIIIALAHMGHPEDIKLAEMLPSINVIVASHTHQTYLEQHGDVMVVQSFRQGEVLRHMRLQAHREGKGGVWKVSLLDAPSDTLLAVNDSVPVHEPTMKLVEEMKTEVDHVLHHSGWSNGLKHSQAVYSAPVEASIFGHNWRDHQLSPILGDCIVQSINKRWEGVRRKVDIFLGLQGMVRGYPQEVDGMISLQFSDIFKMYQQGFDETNATPGSPLCTYYLKKNELWNLLEIGDYVSRFWQEDFLLSPSPRLQVKINPWGLPGVNHINALFDGKEYKDWPEMLHVCTSCALCSTLYASDKVTHGFMSCWPRDENGTIFYAATDVRKATPPLPNAYALLVEYLEQHETNTLRQQAAPAA